MAEKNSQSVPIKGLTDKRNITLTVPISLAGEFLLMQLMYRRKTKASLPRISKGILILSHARPKTLLQRRENS